MIDRESNSSSTIREKSKAMKQEGKDILSGTKEEADVIVTHENLLERAQGANPGIRIVTIQNFLKDQNIDDLYEEIVQKNQK